MPRDVGNLRAKSFSPVSERRLVLAGAILVVLFRSLLFAFRPLSFDSDEAVMGLMGKHLMQARALPLFLYGQNYILAVEAWMAVPMFMLFGVTMVALKLPLLIINIAAACLLVRLLEREAGLRPVLALIASLFFLIPAPITASTLMSANGGNVEPFLYVLLLWIARRHPIWSGVILGVGCVHREFTIYAAMALAGVLAIDGTWRSKDARRSLAGTLGVAAAVWIAIQFVKPYGSALGPGTTIQDVCTAVPSNNLLEVFQRACFDVTTIPGGLARLATFHWV
jgi:hypothetical protein